MVTKAVALLLLCLPAVRAADSAPDLLLAAKKGQAANVRSLLEKGTPVESRDKEGRTALMLAAEHGHAEVVSLLLSKGAKPDQRDQEGLNAYALSVLSTAKGRENILHLLPAPEHVKLELQAKWVPENAYSSCFMNPKQIAERLQEIRPDDLATTALREVAGMAAIPFLELVASDGDAVLTLQVRPGAMCVQQQLNDNLRMEIDVSLMRKGSESAVWQKTFGGGLKGMKAKIATNPVQYGAVYQEWAKAEASPIFWGAVTALLKE
jgi:hypothetical protein